MKIIVDKLIDTIDIEIININNNMHIYDKLDDDSKLIFDNFCNYIKNYKMIKIENFENESFIILSSKRNICDKNDSVLDYSKLTTKNKKIISDIMLLNKNIF